MRQAFWDANWKIFESGRAKKRRLNPNFRREPESIIGYPKRVGVDRDLPALKIPYMGHPDASTGLTATVRASIVDPRSGQLQFEEQFKLSADDDRAIVPVLRGLAGGVVEFSLQATGGGADQLKFRSGGSSSGLGATWTCEPTASGTWLIRLVGTESVQARFTCRFRRGDLRGHAKLTLYIALDTLPAATNTANERVRAVRARLANGEVTARTAIDQLDALSRRVTTDGAWAVVRSELCSLMELLLQELRSGDSVRGRNWEDAQEYLHRILAVALEQIRKGAPMSAGEALRRGFNRVPPGGGVRGRLGDHAAPSQIGALQPRCGRIKGAILRPAPKAARGRRKPSADAHHDPSPELSPARAGIAEVLARSWEALRRGPAKDRYARVLFLEATRGRHKSVAEMREALGQERGDALVDDPKVMECFSAKKADALKAWAKKIVDDDVTLVALVTALGIGWGQGVEGADSLRQFATDGSRELRKMVRDYLAERVAADDLSHLFSSEAERRT